MIGSDANTIMSSETLWTISEVTVDVCTSDRLGEIRGLIRGFTPHYVLGDNSEHSQPAPENDHVGRCCDGSSTGAHWM